MNIAGNITKGLPAITTQILPPRSWARRAACVGHDPNLWFIEDKGDTYAEARAICQRCEVRIECLKWAIETKTEHGLWGGLNPLQRKQARLGRQLDLRDSTHQRFDDIHPKANFL